MHGCPVVKPVSLATLGAAFVLVFVLPGCPPPPSPPMAAFTAEPESGAAPLQVEFTDLSDAGGSAIQSWHWDFGDGVTSDLANPTHTYSAEGTFTVTLTVTNSVGSHSASMDIVVTAGSGAVGPTAAFKVIYDPHGDEFWRGFEDRSDSGTEPIVSWRWDFGDDVTSSERNPQHTYLEPGRYWVTLQVSNALGRDTFAVWISVGIPDGDPDGPGGWVSEYRVVPPRSQFMDLELIAFHDPARSDFNMVSCRDCHGKRFYEWALDETTRASHALMQEYGYRDERCARCHNQGEDLLFRTTKYFRANMFEAGSCAASSCHGPNGQLPLYMVNQ